MAQAMKLADRMYVLDKGQLVDEGLPRELEARADGLAARFFAASRIV
jgi:ABC-type branched-subunit amino acid transport system ATPase component